MTMEEAENIIGIVSLALIDKSWPHPKSLLQGYSVYEIDTAVKLRIANEFLISMHSEELLADFDKAVIYTYGRIPLMVYSNFVSDEVLKELKQKFVPNSREYRIQSSMIRPNPFDENGIKDKKFGSLESIESFASYCKLIGGDDPLYWQKIYTRISLKYTSTSPEGNYPVFSNDE